MGKKLHSLYNATSFPGLFHKHGLGGGDEATLAPSVVITASVEMDGGTEGGGLHFLRRFVPH